MTTILTLTLFQAKTQNNAPTTSEFVVEGQVKEALTVTLNSLKAYATETIDSVLITNHLGQKKSTLKNIKAVPLKHILSQVEILSESPKQLSEFYFLLIAADDYKVVFSWNEVFNNMTGERIYLIAGKDGKEIDELEDKIAVISLADFRTGRRYVKGLKKIVVKQAD